jgi:drug/metabolite transporter (DMT)-like permease
MATTPRNTPRLIRTAEGSSAHAFGAVDWGLFSFCGVVWGASFYFIAVGVDHFAPAVIAAMRLALGSAVLAVAPSARRAIEREDTGRFWFVGLVWMAIPFLLFPIAEQWVASSVAGMINAGVPIFAAGIAAILLRRLPGPKQAIGLVLGLVGVVIVTLPSADDGSSSLLGVILLVVAVALYGLAVNLAVPLQQKYGGLAVTLRLQLAALVMVLPLAIWGLRDSDWAWSSFWATLALGVAGTGLALFAMTNLVGRVGATRGSTTTYTFPIVAILLGVLFRDEELHAVAIVGTMLVLAGAWIASRSERRAPAAPTAPEALGS